MTDPRVFYGRIMGSTFLVCAWSVARNVDQYFACAAGVVVGLVAAMLRRKHRGAFLVISVISIVVTLLVRRFLGFYLLTMVGVGLVLLRKHDFPIEKGDGD